VSFPLDVRLVLSTGRAEVTVTAQLPLSSRRVFFRTTILRQESSRMPLTGETTST